MTSMKVQEKTRFLVWLLEGTRRKDAFRDTRAIYNLTQLIDFPTTPDEINQTKTILEAIIRNPMNIHRINAPMNVTTIYSNSADRIRKKLPLNQPEGTFYQRTREALQRTREEKKRESSTPIRPAAQLEAVLSGKEPNPAVAKKIGITLMHLSNGGSPRTNAEREIQRAINERDLAIRVEEYASKQRKAAENRRRKSADMIEKGEKKREVAIKRAREEGRAKLSVINPANPEYFDLTDPFKQKEREAAARNARRLAGTRKSTPPRRRATPRRPNG